MTLDEANKDASEFKEDDELIPFNSVQNILFEMRQGRKWFDRIWDRKLCW